MQYSPSKIPTDPELMTPNIGDEGRMSDDARAAFAMDFVKRNSVDRKYYAEYDVKRGLRNNDGTGVVAGITQISSVHGYVIDEGDKMPVEGRLTFRGYNIYDLINNAVEADRFGFEEICYLLLLGKLPEENEITIFREILDGCRELPDNFTSENIMRNVTLNIMNMLMRAVSLLYSYDAHDPESTDPRHEVEVAVSLLSRLPRIAVLSYYAKRAFKYNESMILHRFIPGQSTAETILSMLRPNREFTHEEAVMLDIMLMLHAEHGGGNNSTFTCRTLTSAGTDPYSAYAGAIGSLKGVRHGGANIKVSDMFDDIKAHVGDNPTDGELMDYLRKIVRKEAFDKSGLIYGMGHAVYTLSDPRAEICRHHAGRLVKGTEYEGDFKMLESIARLAPDAINEAKGSNRVICPNIDMFSGLVYTMLGIPRDLFTPLFACSRMAGWAAHRFEELVSGGKIIRPAYKSIFDTEEYGVSLSEVMET